MPKYTVLRTVDAYVRYTAEVEAENPTQAAYRAHGKEEDYEWTQESVSTYDARTFTTLDEDGEEIDDTTVGDL